MISEVEQHQRATLLKAIKDCVAVVHEIAAEFDALCTPLYAIFQEHLNCRAADTFCPKPVHPDPGGHLVIAHAWLKTMGW